MNPIVDTVLYAIRVKETNNGNTYVFAGQDHPDNLIEQDKKIDPQGTPFETFFKGKVDINPGDRLRGEFMITGHRLTKTTEEYPTPMKIFRLRAISNVTKLLNRSPLAELSVAIEASDEAPAEETNKAA